VNFKSLFRPSLLKKFLMAFFIVAIIPLIVAEYFTVNKAEQELKSLLNEEYYMVIDQMKRSVDDIYISKWATNLNASSVYLQNNREIDETTLNFLLDANLKKTEEMIILGLKASDSENPLFFMKNELVTKLFDKDGKSVASLFQFQDSLKSDSASFGIRKPIYMPNSQKFYLPIEYPISLGNGRSATLRGVYDLDAVLTYISSAITSGHRELFIVDSSGTIIFKSKNAKFDVNTLLPYPIVDNVKKGLSGESRAFQIEPFSYLGERYLGNFAISQYISWGMVVVDRYSIAYALVAQAKKDIVIWIALAVAFCVIFSVFFARTFSNAIRYLVNISKKIGGGDFNVLVAAPSKDELGQLSISLQEMAVSLKESVRMHEELQTIQQEVKIASRIQQSILPVGAPKLKGLDFGARYIPMAGVAGDFYDFHVLNDDKLGVLIADVSGHGIPAALISAMVKVAFSQQKPIADDPSAVLNEINRTLSGKMEDQFLTASYVHLDLQEKMLQIADAGHLPLMLWRRQEQSMIQIKPKGILIGYMDEIISPVESQPLNIGDRIVLYTDGFVEAHSRAGEEFGETRFVQFIKDHEELPPAEFIDQLVSAVKEWVEYQDGFEDDLTIVVMDILDR